MHLRVSPHQQVKFDGHRTPQRLQGLKVAFTQSWTITRPCCDTRCRSQPDNQSATSLMGLGRRQQLIGLGSMAMARLLLAGTTDFIKTSPAQASTQLRALTPEEQTAVDKAVKSVISKVKAPVALRLIYHDAGTYLQSAGNGGANASIRFELDRPENFGLKRGWRLIEQISESLKNTPAAGLSYADLICLAGAQAVAVCNGPRIPVRVGRKDAMGPDPAGRLPELTFSAQQQKDVFAAMGFSPREFMALMGSHTIGSKGYGAPDVFDNVYYKELLKQPWKNTKDEMASMIGVPSDHVLPDDVELKPIIEEYAQDQAKFVNDFTAAYLKLSELGA